MIKPLVYIMAFLLLASTSQAAEVPADILKRYREIVALIKADKAQELSRLIVYPIKRKNPVPDITNAQQFVAYYKTLFDASFKTRLASFKDADVFEHDFRFGLVGGAFNGDIWLDQKGRIVSIPYSSAAELALQKQLTAKTRGQIYPLVNKWDENVLVAKSATQLIRIDWISNVKGYRLVCWNKGQPISQKPDLIIEHGEIENHGNLGGWAWAFKSRGQTYVVDDIETCADDSPKDCGLFLRMLVKGVEKSLVRLVESK